MGARRAVILLTPSPATKAHAFAGAVGARVTAVVPLARMPTPVEVTVLALSQITDLTADSLVALAGGSTIGLGKALALRTGLPQIAVPTTYAGSEATAITGQTENGRKMTIADPRLQPQVITNDPALARSLPMPLTVVSDLNAIAHHGGGPRGGLRSGDPAGRWADPEHRLAQAV